MAAAAKIREETGVDVETLWGDDGFVVRFPDVDQPPDVRLLLPDPDEVQSLVVRQLGGTALFAAKFRENAARSLLLPKRRPGMRAPLWQQRKRAADLLAVASRYGSFPVLLETYRECLRDFFDMPALVSTLADVRSRKIRVATIDSERPSPFAASLLFSYVASFLYDGDAPLAERRAQALAVDQAQLRELLGDAELRELLDAESMDAIERQLQRLHPQYRAKTADAVHDMLLAIGDLTREELLERSGPDNIEALVRTQRILPVSIAGEPRFIAVEDAARYRDGLDVSLPAGIPESLLQPALDPLGDLALRYARTHAPFTAATFAGRYALGRVAAETILIRLVSEGRLVEGEFRPGGSDREWTDAAVLRMLRNRSLAKLRHEIEPVEQAVLGRFVTAWHGVIKRRHGADALLDAIEQLQGAPLPASILETEILAARIDGYDPTELDAVTSAGEIVWVGVEPIGDRDGRVALYLSDNMSRLLPPRTAMPKPDPDSREAKILDYLKAHGASFFGAVHEAAGAGFPAETVGALWRLAWRGLVTNDTFHALRAFTHTHPPKQRARRREAGAFRSRRLVPPSAEGRWTLVRAAPWKADATAWSAAIAQQLLARHGVVTREALAVESIPGGFGSVYPVLRALEETGRVRRGYFVAGLGAAQFSLPGALDLLRSLRDASSNDAPEVAVLAATDAANPYGATLRWPTRPDPSGSGRTPTRSVGATVILVDGGLGAYLARGDRQLTTYLPELEPQRSRVGRAVSRALIERARAGGDSPRGMLIEEIDGSPPAAHVLAPYLAEAGFTGGAMGFQATFRRS
jgi:ATP-dependent Lhr-like helicase